MSRRCLGSLSDQGPLDERRSGFAELQISDTPTAHWPRSRLPLPKNVSNRTDGLWAGPALCEPDYIVGQMIRINICAIACFHQVISYCNDARKSAFPLLQTAQGFAFRRRSARRARRHFCITLSVATA